MDRFSRRNVSFRDDDDDDDEEEKLYERRALINDDDEFCDDIQGPFPVGRSDIRHRQSDKKRQLNSDGHELRNLGYTKDFNDPPVEFTYYDIQPNDTLQSICLRYTCSYNHVKRLNGLINDNEFYGLRQLKLPLGKLGLLEDILKKQQSPNGSSLDHKTDSITSRKLVNSPGSALSVNTRHIRPRFKPLLSPGYSSDRINELGRNPLANLGASHQLSPSDATAITLQHNSHSFSSLRELNANNDIIDMHAASENTATNLNHISGSTLQQQNFIKSDFDNEIGQFTVDNLLTESDPVIQNIFEDLDYHVEKAKAAAETRDQRVTELVDTIAINNPSNGNHIVRTTTRVSKIPELFFSGENFGLNFKKLVVLIFVVCLFVPLVYINQTNHVVTM